MTDTRREGVILVVRTDHPPVDALGAGLRAALLQAIATATADEGIEAVVIHGGGKPFSAGADITELGRAPVSPLLPELVDAIEASAEPVVAAIHGTAPGACRAWSAPVGHWR